MSEQVVTPPANASAAKVEDTKPAATAPVDGKPADAVTPPPAAAAAVTAEAEKKVETPAEVKPPEAAKVVPEKYELKVPEGSLLGASRVEKISEFAKQNKLSNDEAQAIVEREHLAVNEHMAHLNTQLETQKTQWLEESKNDPAIGGEKFAENVALASRALEHLFPDTGIKKFMDDTGLGNNPRILKGFIQMGQMLQNDKILSPPSGQPPAKSDPIKKMYDHPTSPQS